MISRRGSLRGAFDSGKVEFADLNTQSILAIHWPSIWFFFGTSRYRGW